MDKLYQIIFSEQVYNDLLEIPAKISNEILDKIKHLEVFPQLGMEINRNCWQGYQLVINNYRVLYKILKDKKIITVYHIRHGQRLFD